MRKRLIILPVSLCLLCAPFSIVQAADQPQTQTTMETHIAITVKSVKNTAKGIRIEWKRKNSVQGYYIYRRQSGKKWKRLKQIKVPKTIRYTDTTAKNGVTYEYKAVGYTRRKIKPAKIIKRVVNATQTGTSTAGSTSAQTTTSGQTAASASAVTVSSGTAASQTAISTGQTASADSTASAQTSGTSGQTASAAISTGTQSSAPSTQTTSAGTQSAAASTQNTSSTAKAIPGLTLVSQTSAGTAAQMDIVYDLYYNVPAGSSINYKKLKKPLISTNAYTRTRLTTPAVTNASGRDDASYTVTWEKNTSATGYQLQYASNRVFSGAKTIKITSAKTVSKTISKLARSKSWFFRVRSYKKVGKKTSYSAWGPYKSITVSTKKKVTRTKNVKGKELELRAASKQSMYGYDTVQGCCTDGTYSYHVMYNRKKVNCRIVKIRMSDNKIVKISGVLAIHHGNDITYNPQTKRLVVIHLTHAPLRLTEIDPNKLVITRNTDVAIPTSLSGASDKQMAAIKGFSAIAYDSKNRRYIVRIAQSRNFLVLDENMVPERHIHANYNVSFTNQGISCNGDYIICAQSPSKKTNYCALVIYDWEGNFISQIRLKMLGECESLYLYGNTLYGDTYQSGYRTITIKKKVTVKKKKKVKGKAKTVKVKKTVKKTKKVLFRDNHLFKFTSF